MEQLNGNKMGKIYKTQPIEVVISWISSDAPPDVVASCKIKYVKPDGTSGFWTGVYDPVNRTISYTGAVNSSYGIRGTWTFWPYVTLIDGRNYPGEAITYFIYEEGE
jgi:hypothetical protein